MNPKNFQRAAVVLLAACAPAWSATDSTTFTVSASVSPACDVQATAHSFGAYSPAAGSPLDTSSTISVYCTQGTSYSLALNVGSGGGTFAAREMVSGSDTLVYNLFTTNARTTIWGDGTSSTGTLNGSGSGLLTAADHTVYGRIDIGQDVPPGSYSSTVTVTVTF